MTQIKIPDNMKVLVVEDNESRNQWFRQHIPGVDIAETANNAKLYLVRNNFDLIFLDHDAVSAFVDPDNPGYCDLTFWTVAHDLAYKNYPGIVVIHSGNPVGAARMAALLRTRSAGYTFIHPFGSFDIKYGG